MAKKYLLVDEFIGYSNNADVTNIDPRFLISGSQNVMIRDKAKVAIRGGYVLDGASSSTLSPIISSYDWITSAGSERNLRHYGTTLEWRYVDSNGDATWTNTNMTVTASSQFQFVEYWLASEAKDILIFIDGVTDNLYVWSGAVTTYASSTTNTITKQGTTTWAEERFFTASNKKIRIGGTEYTYTGGEGTTTLTGVTPDPTGAGIAVGAIVHQSIISVADKPAANLRNGLIGVLKNQLYVADKSYRTVYVSSNTDYTDFTVPSPRTPGAPALLTLDSTPVAFIPQEEEMYISAGRSMWFRTKFTLSADLTSEELRVERLKTSPFQGAYHQNSVENAKNSVMFLSFQKTIDTLGRIENINTPDSVELSNVIKDEILSYDLTIPPHLKFLNSQMYIIFPSESKMLIYDFEQALWQPPQIIPGRRLAIIDGEIYVHSNAVPETYKLFSGTNDNENAINAIAQFAYRSYGKRFQPKVHDEWYNEGYIAANTVLNARYLYDFGGFTQIANKVIDGSNSRILFASQDDASLGKNPFGAQPFGSVRNASADLKKFRAVNTFDPQKYYEISTMYYTNTIDAQWEIVAQGGNVRDSDKDNKEIKDE